MTGRHRGFPYALALCTRMKLHWHFIITPLLKFTPWLTLYSVGLDRCIMIHIHCNVTEYFHCSTILCACHIHSSSPLPPWQLLVFFFFLISFSFFFFKILKIFLFFLLLVFLLSLFAERRIVRIIVCSFFRLLLSLSNMPLRFFHVFSWFDSSFLFSVEWYFIVFVYQFIHSLAEGPLGCFRALRMRPSE